MTRPGWNQFSLSRDTFVQEQETNLGESVICSAGIDSASLSCDFYADIQYTFRSQRIFPQCLQGFEPAIVVDKVLSIPPFHPFVLLFSYFFPFSHLKSLSFIPLFPFAFLFLVPSLFLFFFPPHPHHLFPFSPLLNFLAFFLLSAFPSHTFLRHFSYLFPTSLSILYISPLCLLLLSQHSFVHTHSSS